MLSSLMLSVRSSQVVLSPVSTVMIQRGFAKTARQKRDEAAIEAKRKELEAELEEAKRKFLTIETEAGSQDKLPLYEPVRRPVRPVYPSQQRLERGKQAAAVLHERWQRELLEEKFVQSYVQSVERQRYERWKQEYLKKVALVKEEKQAAHEKLIGDIKKYKENKKMVVERFRLARQKIEERARKEWLQVLAQDATMWDEHPSELKKRPYYFRVDWPIDTNH
eukprot:TRINITY_DN860_c0_g4_i1.p1 TRINITY_DN860_c0_g4~~TRINITY_DN860_c0_g4_i1.p1  ORF type:complete len:259 (+),score=74.49 TRINITY_DN860_c0_g4_i1:114-779(+)